MRGVRFIAYVLVAALALLFGFALPPLVALARVPPLRVLRRDIGMPRVGGVLAYAVGAVEMPRR